MNTTIKLQQRGVITLPKKLRDAFGLTEGQTLRIVNENGRIILEPEVTMPKELADSIKQSLADLKAGRYIQFGSLAEFDEKMKSYVRSTDG